MEQEHLRLAESFWIRIIIIIYALFHLKLKFALKFQNLEYLSQVSAIKKNGIFGIWCMQ